MRTMIALAVAAVAAACSDPVADVPVETFDGRWTVSWSCTGVQGGECALPEWFNVTYFADVRSGVMHWTTPDERTLATHVGEVSGECLAVRGGTDDGMVREPYLVCVDDPAHTLVTTVVWNHGTAGQCACDLTLRR